MESDGYFGGIDSDDDDAGTVENVADGGGMLDTEGHGVDQFLVPSDEVQPFFYP